MRSLKWLLACLVLLATDSTTVLTVFSALFGIQRQVVQFATNWETLFYVVRYDHVTEQLVFDDLLKANCYFLKQIWRERTPEGFTTRVYISFQLLLTDGTALPSGFDYYLTRDKNQTLKLYPSNAPFLSSAADIRIFKAINCVSDNNLFASTIYWGSGPYSALTVSEDRVLTLMDVGDMLTCASSHLMIYTYPLVTGPSNASVSRVARRVIDPQDRKDAKGPSRTNRSSSAFGGSVGITSLTTGQDTPLAIEETSSNVQLVIDYGSDRRYIVLVAGASARMASFSRSYHDKSTVFRYRPYITSSIAPQGKLVNMSSFTLLHCGTNSYLVANVSSTGELQAHSGMSGLSFAPQSDFDLGVGTHPDYRFFVQYYVRLPDGRSARTFCSLFFRNYCLWPAATVKLSLRPVQTEHSLTTPTFTDPDSGALLSFYDRARRAARSLNIPVLSFNPVSPLHGEWKSTGYKSASTHKRKHAA